MKKLLFLSLLTSSMFAMELGHVNYKKEIVTKLHDLDRVSYSDNKNKLYIEPFSVKVPEYLGSLDLYHSNKGFYVRQDDKKFEIKKYFTDPMLRNITKTQLKAFLTEGYLSINQMNDGEYSLKAKGRIVGGGPALGVAAYWVTKSLCYAVGFVAIGGATAATGGAVGGVIGGSAVVGGAALGTTAAVTTATTAIVTSAGVVTGTVVTGAAIGTTASVIGGVAAGVGGTALVGNAALATGAVVTGAGGIGATIAGIETLSVAVGSFFGMLPTP